MRSSSSSSARATAVFGVVAGSAAAWYRARRGHGHRFRLPARAGARRRGARPRPHAGARACRDLAGSRPEGRAGLAESLGRGRLTLRLAIRGRPTALVWKCAPGPIFPASPHWFGRHPARSLGERTNFDGELRQPAGTATARRPPAAPSARSTRASAPIMLRVYNYMAIGLVLTGVTALADLFAAVTVYRPSVASAAT